MSAKQLCAGAWKTEAGIRFLGEARAAAFSYVNQRCAKSAPRFEGTLEQFLEGKPPQVAASLKNKVKKCASCGKPNAFTLGECNQCSSSLVDTPISYTDNIFAAFVFGVAKGRFPYSVSLRYQDERFLVFDDLLALSPCHFNAIPTTRIVPHWLALLREPREALGTIEALLQRCQEVLDTQFLGDAEWTSRVLAAPASSADLLTGFNYPPSQYHLHLQCCFPPFLPFQYRNFLAGIHFTKGRFFPYSYVHAVLSHPDAYPHDVEACDASERVIEFYAERGVSYDEHHAALMERAEATHVRLAKWGAEEGRFGRVVDDWSEEAKEVAQQDKLTLQNYGRPYDAESGKPSLTYYAHAKSVDQVKV